VADNNAPPPGLDELIAGVDAPSQSPSSETPIVEPGQELSGSEPPPGLDELIAPEVRKETYGTVPQKLAAAAEGAASTLTFGLSTKLETSIGKLIDRENPPEALTEEAIRARREVNPGTYLAGQAIPLIATSVGSALGAAGRGVGELVGLGAEAAAKKAFTEAIKSGATKEVARAAEKAALQAVPVMERIGSKAVTGVIENGLFQSGDEVSKMFSGAPGYENPGAATETALVNIGLASVIGGGISGGFGAVSPLWDATVGKGVQKVLKKITDRAGGIEGVTVSPVDDFIAKSGIDVPPEMKATLSDDPFISQQAKALQASEGSKSSLAFQESQTKFKNDLSNHVVESLGRKPADLGGDLSTYELGKSVGKELASEFDAGTAPLSKEFDTLRGKFNRTELSPSIATKTEQLGLAEAKALEKYNKSLVKLEQAELSGSSSKIAQARQNTQLNFDSLNAIQKAKQSPGTTDLISEQLSKLAADEGWAASPSSDIMREINRIQKELPLQKTLNNLSDYIEQVGNNMQSDPMNKALNRAGGKIKQILRDAESDIISKELGTKEGPEALARYQGTREAYRAQSLLKDALESRLHLKAKTAGYAKALKEAAQTDGELLLKRLSGNNDADLLQLLQQNFPKTAQAVKQANLDQILHKAANAAKEGQAFNPDTLLKSIKSMSPEMRDFVFTPEMLSKVESLGTVLKQLGEKPKAATGFTKYLGQLLDYLPASAAGLGTALLGHGALMSVGVAGLARALSKDVPDAARLALLKFIGSGQKLDAAGFGTAVQFIKSAIKAEKLITRGISNVFKAGQEVLPQAVYAKESDLRKLDKSLKIYQADPMALANIGGKTGHYLPQQGQELSQVSANAVTYLNSLRPTEFRNSPLDTPIKPRPDQLAEYNRALTIAQQPLTVLPAIKNGTITPKDIIHLKMLYPALYSRLSSKLISEVAESANKGILIPYKTKLGISLFTMQAMDSTMQPSSINAAQMTSGAETSEQTEQNQQQEQLNKPMRANARISKIPNQYQTPSQASEIDRQRRGR